MSNEEGRAMPEVSATPNDAGSWEAAAKQAGWIPPQRLSEVVAERNELRSQVAGMKAESIEQRAELEQNLAEARAAFEEAKARAANLESERAWSSNEVLLAREGINDPEIVDYLRHRYESAPAPEEGEKAGFGDWFTDYRSSDPAVLRSFQSGAAAPRPAPSTNAGAKPVGSDQSFDPSQLTHEQYRANRAKLLEGVKLFK